MSRIYILNLIGKKLKLNIKLLISHCNIIFNDEDQYN